MSEASGTCAAHKLSSAAKAALRIKKKEITSSRTLAGLMNKKKTALNPTPASQPPAAFNKKEKELRQNRLTALLIACSRFAIED